MIWPTLTFCCETCGRTAHDYPSAEMHDVSIFPGDDGSCCREQRARFAQLEAVAIVHYAMVRIGRLPPSTPWELPA